MGHVDIDEVEVHGSNPYDTDKALPSGSDGTGAQAVNREEPGKQCTFF